MREPKNNNNSPITVYKQLLRTLGNTLKTLKTAEANQEMIDMYDQLLSYLKSLRYDDFQDVLNSGKSTKRSQDRYKGTVVPDEQIINLSLDEIKSIITNSKTSRKRIEKIAIIRFGMRKSEVISIKNKENLIEQLFTLISNQETHESISRVASKKDEKIVV